MNVELLRLHILRKAKHPQCRDPITFAVIRKAPHKSLWARSLLEEGSHLLAGKGKRAVTALELIRKQSASFKSERIKDEYEAAVKELVHAQLHNRPIPKGNEKLNQTRSSISWTREKGVETGARTSAVRNGHNRSSTHEGLTLVKSKAKRVRKSA